MAAYKSPRIVQFADSLPKSGTGKVQWRALQEQERNTHRRVSLLATPRKSFFMIAVSAYTSRAGGQKCLKP